MESEREKENRNGVPILRSGIGTRIDAAARRIGTRTQAATACGVSDDMLYRYIREESPPPFSAMVGLARESGFRLEWIATGEGPMYLNEVRENIAAPDGAVSGADIDVDLLSEVLEALDMLATARKWRPTRRVKARFASKLYKYYKEKEAAEGERLSAEDLAKIMDLIGTAIIGEEDHESEDDI